MAGLGQNKRGKDDCALTEKQRIALELRKAGVGYEEIARRIGCNNPGTAYKAVKVALKKTLREPAEAVRKMELERLDRLMFAHWQKAMAGDAKASSIVMAIMDRRARMLGLDAPAKTQVSGDANAPLVIKKLGGVTMDEL